MKRFITLTILSLSLAACVDKTGLTAESAKTVHPKTNPNAAVTVVEFGDLQCPACRSAQTLVTNPIIEKYGMKIRFEYHQFPLSSIHQYAMIAAEASECAADQGKFWEFVDYDYTNQDKLSPTALDQWGKDLGLDTDLYNRCRRSHIKRPTVQAEYDEGSKIGVRGTPTYFVNGQQVEATVDAMSAAIDAALATAGKNL